VYLFSAALATETNTFARSYYAPGTHPETPTMSTKSDARSRR